MALMDTVRSKVAETEKKTSDTPLKKLEATRDSVAGLSERVRKGKFTLAERVHLYGVVNGMKKDVEKVQKHLNSEIKEEVEEVCEKADSGELSIPEKLPETYQGLLSKNAKGYIFVRDGDAEVELRAFPKEVFDEVAARAVLVESGLLEDATETTRTITDPESLLEVISEVMSYLDDLNGEQPLAGEMFDNLDRVLSATVEESAVLSEAKIEDLVRNERLDVARVPEMFSTQVSYRLYG